MEKIIGIKECSFKTEDTEWATLFDGFEIETDQQTIRFGISSKSSCCESFGYLSSSDNTQEFIGAEILSIKMDGDPLNVNSTPGDIDAGGVMFVTVETSIGPFQMTAYNSHNGYYSHEAVVVSTQLKHSESL